MMRTRAKRVAAGGRIRRRQCQSPHCRRFLPDIPAQPAWLVDTDITAPAVDAVIGVCDLGCLMDWAAVQQAA